MIIETYGCNSSGLFLIAENKPVIYFTNTESFHILGQSFYIFNILKLNIKHFLLLFYAFLWSRMDVAWQRE